MRKTSRWVLLVGFVLATEGGATATGTRIAMDVTIVKTTLGAFPNITSASGSLGSARNGGTGAMNKEIGCKVVPTLQGNEATCLALTPAVGSSPGQLSCHTKEPQFVTLVNTLGSDSVLTFFTYQPGDGDGDYPPGECVAIFVENSSKYEPKQP
jgi:hypothetical protein